MEIQQLQDYRVTLSRGKVPGRRQIDKWMDQHRVTGDAWVGYTFFEMKARYQADDHVEATP